MHKSPKTPIVILNGFLGSGKTTLFRNLIYQSKTKNIPICTIVNDMSELDVDGELIGSSDIVEENKKMLVSIHGCVLSSKKGLKELENAIETLLSDQSPELIIVETSGSCHPMPLIELLKNHSKVKLTAVFALVDSLMLSHDYQYGEELIPKMKQSIINNNRTTVNLLVEQIMFCSHLLLTKTDRIDKEKLPEIASYIQDINPFITIHSVLFGKLKIESILDIEEYNYDRVTKLVQELTPVLELEKDQDEPYNIVSRVIKDDRPFHPQRLWDVCHQYLDQRIYRSKGFFWLPNRAKQSLLWNQAAGGINLEIIGYWRSGILESDDHNLSEIEIEKLEEIVAQEQSQFGDRHCELTVIGDKDHVDKFTDALKTCFLDDDEINLWYTDYEFKDPWPKNILRIKNDHL